MVVVYYHAKQVDSASIGAQVVDVECDHCRCTYYYVLARVGSGSATAHYAIGAAKAVRSAAAEAGRDLERRLDEEAELVPCPQCQWINESLVEGYRRGRFRSWTKASVLIGVVGTASSLAMAWFLAIGPAADQGALPYFLIGGPVVSLLVAGTLPIVRRFLRNRIDPNRDYPLSPVLPPGSPAPLLLNPTTGELEPARPAARIATLDDPWWDFQAGRDSLPQVCCDCLGPADGRSAYRRPLQPAVVLSIPLCRPCARRWRGKLWLGAVVAFGLLAAVGLPVLMALRLDEVVFWMTIVGLGIVVPLIGAMIAGRLVAPVWVQVVDGPRGVVRLRFRNADYLYGSAAG